ncbi:GNAT family acetyltransferase [Brevibacillus agri]|uniref:GNAT family acetyltransferase n=1 Tax=Brevibacillus agri TaxID=51101 RepID=UPI00047249A9|nr:GNAT family acetyltransferase [Brevibacillus agri]MCG5254588.1 GNAT family acetyltransferase [Brevibacillus agri]MED1644137.1 GNAT family acetyltransferase [Brevibacillus agri]MED1656600.1 GNAT family acetyltransferase [Brevibacillus agri]MED1688489.1 GNAT family acetyltransferase [Brevibacillus agri]MED1694958.1 GNAT family acetyltransferase [Brevibacillus agri]
MQLQSFALEQYEAVVELWQRAGLVLSRSDTREGLRRKLERDPELFLVATNDDGQVVGAVMGSYDGRRGWVNHLAVDPACQGQALGSRLMQELERRLMNVGCEKINLLIEPENSGVQSFYRQLGFAACELIFMEKWIAPPQDAKKGV